MIPIILKGVKSRKLFCVLHLNNDVVKVARLAQSDPDIASDCDTGDTEVSMSKPRVTKKLDRRF